MEIKKISALLVLAIFVLSLVPLAFAEGTNTGNTGESTKAAEKTKIKDLTEKVKETKEQVKDFRATYNGSKQDYQEAKKSFLESRDKLKDAKEEAKNCIDETKAECKQKKQKLKNETKSHLINLADVILSNLEKVKEKIQASGLSEEEKTGLLEDINSQIQAVTGAKETLQKIAGDVTQEELQAATKTIQEAWKGAKPTIKRGLGSLIGLKLGNIFVKVEALQEKFNRTIAALETKGADTSKLKEYQADLETKLASAKDQWEQAKTKFREAKTAANAEALIAEAHQDLKDAQEIIKEIREDIKKIVQEIKDQQKAVSAAKENQSTENPNNENEGTTAA